MKTLREAWQWYESTQHQLRLMERLAARYWDRLPWEGVLSQDDWFRLLEGKEAQAEADFSLSYLNDMAVVMLFSVFESLVRHQVLEELKREEPGLRHRALKLAAAETRQRIEEGSFFHVLEPFKDFHADLIEEVNQVRRYRNWVAHGKRGIQPPMVSPQTAYDRLSRFLQVLDNESGSRTEG